MSLISVSPALREYRKVLQKASSPGNRTLNRRIAAEGRRVIHRLGYNTATAVYSLGTEIEKFSGSSLNRMYAKKKRDENREIFEKLQDSTKKRYSSNSVFREFKDEICRLREIAADKCRIKKRIPVLSDKRDDSIRLFSKRSKGKVRDKCTALHQCLGKEKTFVTLTFINDLSDKTGIVILNKFFTALRDRFGKLQYIWVAERQKTGRIHFHIILNKYLDVREFNALWTLQQYNEGIQNPDICKDELLAWIEYDQKNLHQKSEVGKRFNSFDVKHIKTIYGLSWYLTKYITKGNNKSGFNCSVWHCSRSVSRLFTKTLISREVFQSCGSIINYVKTKLGPEISLPQQGKFHLLYFINNKSYYLPEMFELERVNTGIVSGIIPRGIFSLEEEVYIKNYLN